MQRCSRCGVCLQPSQTSEKWLASLVATDKKTTNLKRLSKKDPGGLTVKAIDDFRQKYVNQRSQHEAKYKQHLDAMDKNSEDLKKQIDSLQKDLKRTLASRSSFDRIMRENLQQFDTCWEYDDTTSKLTPKEGCVRKMNPKP